MKRAAINIFLAFHLIAITCWALPVTSPLIEFFRSAIRPYFLWTGLFQTWDMFAPSPKSVNSYVEAFVIRKSGNVETWMFPRMYRLNFTERYGAERYRKFVENLADEKNAVIWPDVARRVAWSHRSVSNPPEIIILVLHWSDIVPRFGLPYGPDDWRQRIFFEYNVKSRDLE